MSSASSSAPKPTPGRKRIGELLVEAEVLQEKHIDEALALQKEKGGKIVENLMMLGHLDPKSFARFLSSQRGIPSMELAQYQVPEDIVSLIPGEMARQHQIFPVDKMGKLLTIGMECPLDTEAIEALEAFTGLKIKPFLCSQSDIRDAIEQHYPVSPEGDEETANADPGPAEAGVQAHAPREESSAGVADAAKLETGIKIKNVLHLIKEIDGLPTLPQTVQQVKKATDDPDSSLKDVADLIASDPPIAAKVLKLANSAAYGFPSRIDDIIRATTLLGPKETYSIVLSSAILDLTDGAHGFDHKKYWADSIYCASVAKNIATACAPEMKSASFMAGLLHDIGRFALSQTAPGQYSKIDGGLSGSALVTAERRAFLIAHPEAGYILASHWGLPDEISDAIRFHHNPELSQEDTRTAHVVALAARLTEVRNDTVEGTSSVPEDCLAYCAELDIEPAYVSGIVSVISTSVGAEAS